MRPGKRFGFLRSRRVTSGADGRPDSRCRNWGVTLLVVPVMYFVFIYYRMHIFRAVLDNISDASQENETLLAGVSQGR